MKESIENYSDEKLLKTEKQYKFLIGLIVGANLLLIALVILSPKVPRVLIGTAIAGFGGCLGLLAELPKIKKEKQKRGL